MPQKRLRDKAVQALLRHVGKASPPNAPILRPYLYKLLLISRRLMAHILDPTHQKSIHLFLRQQDTVFECSAFGIINCGQTFDYKRSLTLIRIFGPQCIDLVLIGKNLKPLELLGFLKELKAFVPTFITTHHRNLARSVAHLQQRILLESLSDKLKRVELWEGQLPCLHQSPLHLLDKCVIHCKSNLGNGQLTLALKTKTRIMVGRYRIQEFFTCGDFPPQPVIEELQLINDDAAWRVFCEPDSMAFFDLLQEKLPSLNRLVFGMSDRLLKENERFTGNCVEDLMNQVMNFKRTAFLNSNHDLREHCRTQFRLAQTRAIKQGIQLFLCYDTKNMFSIHDDTAKFWPIELLEEAKPVVENTEEKMDKK